MTPKCNLLLIVGLSVFLAFSEMCSASMRSCDGSPRVIGAFGAENTPRAPVTVSAEVRAQLPGVTSVIEVLNTQLAPSGEQVIVYSTNEDESDPLPKVAFITGGKLAKIMDASEMAPEGGGFWRFLSGCQFDVARNQKALALAFSTSFHGFGSAFAVIIWRSSDYQVVFNPLITQGRMVLSSGKLALWDSDGTGECVWCRQHYLVRNYEWHNKTYVRTTVVKLKKAYDPATISGTPLVIAGATDQN